MQTVMSLASSVLVQGGVQKFAYDSTQQQSAIEQLSTFSPTALLDSTVLHSFKDNSQNGFAITYKSCADTTKNIFAVYKITNNQIGGAPLCYLDRASGELDPYTEVWTDGTVAGTGARISGLGYLDLAPSGTGLSWGSVKDLWLPRDCNKNYTIQPAPGQACTETNVIPYGLTSFYKTSKTNPALSAVSVATTGAWQWSVFDSNGWERPTNYSVVNYASVGWWARIFTNSPVNSTNTSTLELLSNSFNIYPTSSAKFSFLADGLHLYGKPIVNVGDPEEEHHAVNLRTLNQGLQMLRKEYLDLEEKVSCLMKKAGIA